MRVLVLLSMAVTASAFGVTSRSSVAASTKSTSQMFGMPEDRTEESLANEVKANRWKEIRLLSDEEAEKQLTGEELESFTTYHANIKEDMQKMKEIATMMLKSLEPPKIQSKGKKQRKRDKWAKKVKIAEVRARELKALTPNSN